MTKTSISLNHLGLRRGLAGLACFVLATGAFAEELGDLVRKASQGDQAAYDSLLSKGMQTHALLTRGPRDTEAVRKRLRADLRRIRDEALRQKGFVVHEWGASRFLQNAQNEIMISAPASSDDLPPWVNVWSRLPRGGHTEFLLKPVIHFYAERPVSVNVSVRSRDGMLTEWWPSVTRYMPPRPALGQDVVWRTGGRLDWVRLLVNPFATKPLMEAPDESWWTAARAIESAPVIMDSSAEKFLFYRGVSRAKPLVNVSVQPDSVTIQNPSQHTVASLFVVSVRDGRLRCHPLSTLRPKAAAVVDSRVVEGDPTLDEGVARVSDMLQEALEVEGLYPAEAKMVLGIWQEELFRTDGLRVIYIRPPRELNASLPLSISPTPASLARAFFAYIECMSPMAESQVKALVADLAHDAFERREKAQAQLTRHAALWLELLTSARQAAEDPEVQTRLDQILATVRSSEPGETF